jgi:hypothetical protein
MTFLDFWPYAKQVVSHKETQTVPNHQQLADD